MTYVYHLLTCAFKAYSIQDPIVFGLVWLERTAWLWLFPGVVKFRISFEPMGYFEWLFWEALHVILICHYFAIHRLHRWCLNNYLLSSIKRLTKKLDLKNSFWKMWFLILITNHISECLSILSPIYLGNLLEYELFISLSEV